MFDLTNKNIILTGSAGFLGSEYANALSMAGANVILVDISKSKNKQVMNNIKEKYETNASSFQVDITKPNQVKKLKKDILKKYNVIDGLVNNAFLSPRTNPEKFSKPFEEFSLDIWNKTLEVNLTGVFLLCQEFGQVMVKQKSGSIVNIGSIYGLVGADQRIYGSSKINSPVSYAVTKGAIVNLTRYLAAYWDRKNIRVNTLTLGGVQDEKYMDKQFIKKYSDKTILGRMAKKEEYSGALIFLLSNASSYMTGANLVVDGGWTAW